MIAYDPMTMRWLNESTPNKDNNYNSTVFANGYEDPTYLTFRIEFGGWGASTLDINYFKELQLFNNTQDYSKVHTFNYDEYPVGLLDLNFAENSITQYPAYSFNEQVTYNAYNYLLQRNEDVRAEYIKTFIEGLYEIQKEYPYLFQDISGLNGLEQINTTRGSRLKDVTITLKCIEGLAQKIRALLECYKKAAWDATYQRWILPENYRQFKMIIYIFERRTFHHVEPYTQSPSQQLGSNIVNTLLTQAGNGIQAQISGQAHPMMHHTVNPLLPVMAYECNLCEFLINDAGIGDSFSANWNSTEPLETTLQISVKNVKTYYYNGLVKQLSDLMVADLENQLERADVNYFKTISNSKSINREIIYQNDIGNIARPGWGGDDSLMGAVNAVKSGWNDMCNSYKKAFSRKKGKETTADNGNDPGSILSLQKASMNAESALLIEERDANWWHDVTIGGDVNWNMKKFWKSLWNVITAGTQQIRLSPGYPNAQLNVFNNILDYLEYNENWEGSFYSYATRADDLNSKDLQKFTQNFDTIPYTEFQSTATRDNQKLTNEKAKSLTDDMIKSETSAGINNRENKIESDYNMAEKKDDKTFYEQNNTSIGDIKMEMTTINEMDPLENQIIPDNDLLDTVELPENNIIETDLEFPDYTYPNSAMDTVSAVKSSKNNHIGGTIDFKKYQVQQPLLNIALDKSQGNLIIEQENGLYASLQPIEGGLQNVIMDESGMIVLEKTDAKNMIMHNVTTPTEEFTKLDEVFYTAEDMITTMLAESELLSNIEVTDSLEHIGNTDNLLEVAAELANENNTIKAQYAEHISKLLDTLQQETLEVIDTVPEMQLVGYDNEEEANKKFIELPIEAVKQLKDNMQLCAIERPELSHMSMQSMVAVERAAEYAVLNTSAMLEVIKQPEFKNETSRETIKQ